MPRLFQKLIAFLRWVFAPEQLPDDVAGTGPMSAGRPGFSRWLLHGDMLGEGAGEAPGVPQSPGFFRALLAPESLPDEVASQGTRLAPPPRFWPWILSADTLPEAEPADHEEASRTRFLTRLFQQELCPECPHERVEARAGFFRQLVAPEECPVNPVHTPQVRKGFVRWALERQECPMDSTPSPQRRPGFWRKLFASEEL